ncbi:hypothetical protein TTHERM_00151620 (macronuclear) [Tetrahymena thermophila SB210]|uniref:Uncharacterized protein n=1 Tax=Tetrahymena thermophila (strain SB210) TaxID=312017 RepID=I7MLA0_TETTS|nr:hypothetical protein TTHERM_00151620 [Tetrahymena thermophila SB210]EAS01449.2 hypothetical protein TTHERM_00151620 [Tetrahymena thermophila SB210]|eukprot:XP_001021695.2 hypothetical protein TTHERM_00151620 [Tetrahymena thermophila SB210]
MGQEDIMQTSLDSRPKKQNLINRARSISTSATINCNNENRLKNNLFLSRKNDIFQRAYNQNNIQKSFKITKNKQNNIVKIEDQSTIGSIRPKNYSIFSNSSNMSSSQTKYSQLLEDQSDNIIQKNVKRRKNSNCSTISNQNSINFHIGTDQTIPSQNGQKTRIDSPLSSCKKKVELNIEVSQKQRVKNFNTLKNHISFSKNNERYQCFAEDSIIDEISIGTNPKSPKSICSTKCSPRSRILSFFSYTDYQQNLENIHSQPKNFQKQQRIYFYDIKKYLFNCYDEFDHKRFGTILNQDSPLDYNFLKDFIQINQRFISDNLSFQIASLEKMHINNYRVSIDCLLKLQIAKKDAQSIQNYIKQLEDYYNKKQKNLSAVYRNKMLKFNKANGKVQLSVDDFIKSPFDLVLIIDYNNEFQKQIQQTIHQILDQTNQHSRICLIFPDFIRGKCVRTDLLICNNENKQILQDLIQKNLFNCQIDQINNDYLEYLEDEEQKKQIQKCSYFQFLKSKAGFHEIAFQHAFLTLTQKTYINYQQSIFLISDGYNPPNLETIRNKFNYFSTQNNYNLHNIDENLSFKVFQYCSKNQTDESLFNLSQLKGGRYFYVQRIDDLQHVVNQAMNDLNSNVAFSTIASVDLTNHSQINLKSKDQFIENFSQTRPRQTSIANSILYNQQINFEYLDEEQEIIRSDLQEGKNQNPQKNIKEKIVEAQISGQKLFTQEISKLYGGQLIWFQESSQSISIKIQHFRHGQQKIFPFCIDLKPSNLLAQSEIAEFTIANGTCLFFASSEKFHSKAFTVIYQKKFCSCQAEIHFYLNKNQTYNISTLNFHTSSRQISYNQMNLEKNQASGFEIVKYITYYEFIESLEQIIESYLQKSISKQEFMTKIRQILLKNPQKSLGNFLYQVQSLLSYLNDSERNIIATLYFKSVIQSCKLQC